MKNHKEFDGAIAIDELAHGNLLISEITGGSILIYKETAVELAEYIIQTYGNKNNEQ